MPRPLKTSRLAAKDSLSNFAAELGTGRDKAAHDHFVVADLARDQVEAMYRGDWLARKIVDIVPYDCVREWREWAGDRAAVTAIARAEQRLGLRRALQRAMVLGRLYGGGAIILGTDESDPAALAAPLHAESLWPGGLRFLHVVSRWQLAVDDTIRDPLDRWFGEPTLYRLTAPDRGELALHPSRVVRFLGNPLPDPLLYGAQLWSDSVLQTLYDAIHGVALTATGTTSLVHEAKVDIITVPGLAEHLSNAATTNQLSARFAYASAMKSINNLLLLGDGETWQRQQVDFGGLPDLVRTFLQIAAGAADIPVTRLLGQSPSGLSATGESDTRNYYDMISARQELDLRPQLERIDALLLRSAGVDPASVCFEFRPLWQLSAAEKAGVALQKAQASQIYAGLNLWPKPVMAGLVQAQLAEDGVYPNAEGVFGAGRDGSHFVSDFGAPLGGRWWETEPRLANGRWTNGAAGEDAPEESPSPEKASFFHEFERRRRRNNEAAERRARAEREKVESEAKKAKKAAEEKAKSAPKPETGQHPSPQETHPSNELPSESEKPGPAEEPTAKPQPLSVAKPEAPDLYSATKLAEAEAKFQGVLRPETRFKFNPARAAAKGYPGIGVTPNGGPTFVGTEYLYRAGEGQRSVVKVKLTGSRRADFKAANELGGFAATPEGYSWHHRDDFDPETGTSTLELVKRDAHTITFPHRGSAAQYEKFHGVRYKS